MLHSSLQSVSTPSRGERLAGASSPAAPAPAWVRHFDLGGGRRFSIADAELDYFARFAIREIFVQERYRRAGYELRPDDTVVDVGANMGLFALWAAPQVPRGRVVCFEPTEIVRHLEWNVAQSGLTNVHSRQVAVGRDGTDVELVYYPGQTGLTHQVGLGQTLVNRLFTRYQAWRHGYRPRVVRAPCVSLERLLDEAGVDRVALLKIDCEGGEYEILAGLSPACAARIDRMTLEFHSPGGGRNYRQLLRHLAGLGYRVEVVTNPVDFYLSGVGELWAHRA